MSLGKHTKVASDNYSKGSKKKLQKNIVHRIKKIFVTCLDLIEDELTFEQFNIVRKKILGVGNDQIRQLEAELQRYNVEYIPYHIEMKVKPIEGVPEDIMFKKGKKY